MCSLATKKRILILGGGFGGVAGLDSETALLLLELEQHDAAAERSEEGESRIESAIGGGAVDRVPFETTFLTPS